ncbi:sensor domain-containing diguanylate cyclase [Ideonella azotifigens]|uniref:sensor domain-containing diguanylate cyclase n=2 Tax=Ideonella azotifigens TaxID=513160 RepID=UPI001E2B3898|nr:diguanylate cyclase [Ideonella azotifigens]MCD2341797.1 sensor domain-containing diguanylate cyclase [Ideonella azotifigens]
MSLPALPPCPAAPSSCPRTPAVLAAALLRRLFMLLCLLAGLAALQPAWAQETLALDYLAEPGAAGAQPLSLAAVRALPESAWQHAPAGGASLGYSDKTHWFRARVLQRDPTELRRLLEIAYPVLDRIELHLQVTPAGQPPSWHKELVLGDKQAFELRPVRHANFVVPVDIPLGAELEVLARVTTSSAVQFPLLLWTPATFHPHAEDTNLLLGGYLGLMFGLLAYNLILWASVRERGYLLYGLWVISIAGCITSLKGLSFQYLWPHATQWNDTAIVVLLALTGASGSAFAADFIRIVPGPRWRRWAIHCTTGASLLVAAAALVLPYSVAIRTAISSSVVAIFILTVLALLRAREGYAPARIFLLAFGSVLLGGVLLALDKFGLVARSVFTENALQLGSAMEVLMISLGLASRLNEERELRVKSQIEALKAQREAQELLEARVNERTSALEQANRRLAELSMTDGLTAIPNRRFLDQALEHLIGEAIGSKRSLSLALIDVDHFKQFNDTHGHLAGDQCLQVVALELQRQAHRTEDLVARFGGEEFCIVMPHAGPDGALTVAERMRQAVQALAVPTSVGAVGITVSIGVCSLVPRTPEDLAVLLKATDEALYRAKRNGRNQVVMQLGDAATPAPAPNPQALDLR